MSKVEFIKENVVLVDKTVVNSRGRDLRFLKIADPVTYESVECFAAKDFDINLLEKTKNYTAIITLDGRYSSLRLVKPNVRK